MAKRTVIFILSMLALGVFAQIAEARSSIPVEETYLVFILAILMWRS